ncbi:MAG: IgGFc-binding protein [bacterium]
MMCCLRAMIVAVLFASAGCSDRSPAAECEPGRLYCEGDRLLLCRGDGVSYDEQDCAAVNQVCHAGLGCLDCHPDGLFCLGDDVVRCTADGAGFEQVASCRVTEGEACYLGNCIQACEKSVADRSYVGCEYWAVDLDNARISSVENAAAQQFAVVVSNVSGMPARVVVEQNNAPPGWPLELEVVTEVTVPPKGLQVIALPSREVDGSPPGEFDAGGHSALTSNAYRVTSNVPIVAYQFNPLENVDVFSNDASLLIPSSAIDRDYIVMGWPQTIADTTDPATDFHRNLRAFLTVVGVEPGTDVSITVATDVVGSEQIPAMQRGETRSFSLGPFDVLNLETGHYLADFTGSLVEADKPVVVFSGSEASDVPYVPDLSTRRCCADHLEHQLFPISSAGVSFVAARTPARTPAVLAAGGDVSVVEEPEYFRILATENNTLVVTALPPPDDRIQLDVGEHVTLEAWCDFTINASQPIFVGQFTASQATTGLDLQIPGGDPSFILVPPIEQWRPNYVFLTPNKYAFDFIIVVAPPNTPVFLDELPLPDHCETEQPICGASPDPTAHIVYRCQLSFPRVNTSLPYPDNIEQGVQDDGYHVLTADRPVGLIVYGFDSHVSYGYAGGLYLKKINVK